MDGIKAISHRQNNCHISKFIAESYIQTAPHPLPPPKPKVFSSFTWRFRKPVLIPSLSPLVLPLGLVFFPYRIILRTMCCVLLMNQQIVKTTKTANSVIGFYMMSNMITNQKLSFFSAIECYFKQVHFVQCKSFVYQLEIFFFCIMFAVHALQYFTFCQLIVISFLFNSACIETKYWCPLKGDARRFSDKSARF